MINSLFYISSNTIHQQKCYVFVTFVCKIIWDGHNRSGHGPYTYITLVLTGYVNVMYNIPSI